MRLDEEEKLALKYALEGIKGEVYLFGSRIDDSRKGGDIDILIFSEAEAYRLSQNVSVKFFKKCEEKIDVIVIDKNNLSKEQQAFLNTIKMEKLIL